MFPQLRPQAVPAFDIMPDPPYPSYGGSGGYGGAGSTAGLGYDRAKLDRIRSGRERNRRFNNDDERVNGKYLYQISMWRWFKKASEKVRGRVYGLGQDRQRIKNFRVIEDCDNLLHFEMIIEIEYVNSCFAEQFEKLIKLTGANIKAV